MGRSGTRREPGCAIFRRLWKSSNIYGTVFPTTICNRVIFHTLLSCGSKVRVLQGAPISTGYGAVVRFSSGCSRTCSITFGGLLKCARCGSADGRAGKRAEVAGGPAGRIDTMGRGECNTPPQPVSNPARSEYRASHDHMAKASATRQRTVLDRPATVFAAPPAPPPCPSGLPIPMRQSPRRRPRRALGCRRRGCAGCGRSCGR